MLRERKTAIGSGARYVARDDWIGDGFGTEMAGCGSGWVVSLVVVLSNSGHGWGIVASPVAGFVIAFAVNVNSIMRLLGGVVWQV